MTVERMIKELQKLNPKADVKLHHFRGESALFVLGLANDDQKVWIEGESDVDLGEELGVRFDKLGTEDIDETGFYKDLSEIGITPEIVDQYIGKDKGDRMRIILSGK